MVLSPILIFVGFSIALWLAAQAGAYCRTRRQPRIAGQREDSTVTLSATLTLLGLIIGFSFSMAVGRYDLRKNYEEEEANAIGTEYVRAGLLPSVEATKIRGLLRRYLDQRISYYQVRDASQLPQLDTATAQTQNELWSAVQAVASVQPTPIVALAVSGMNDVLNRQGYTQAAFRNRIPIAAWLLMGAIAVFSNFLLGFYAQHSEARLTHFLVLPLMVATAFVLIADMDTPRQGAIRVIPQNLLSLSQSLSAP